MYQKTGRGELKEGNQAKGSHSSCEDKQPSALLCLKCINGSFLKADQTMRSIYNLYALLHQLHGFLTNHWGTKHLPTQLLVFVRLLGLQFLKQTTPCEQQQQHQSGVVEELVMERIGRRSVNGIQNYKRTFNEQHEALSDILNSKRPCRNPKATKTTCTCSSSGTDAVGPHSTTANASPATAQCRTE